MTTPIPDTMRLFAAVNIWHERTEAIMDRISTIKLISRAKGSNRGTIDEARNEVRGLMLAFNYWSNVSPPRDHDRPTIDIRDLLCEAVAVHDRRILCVFNDVYVLLLNNSDVYKRRNNHIMVTRLNALASLIAEVQREARQFCRDLAVCCRPAETPSNTHSLKVVGGAS